jgi:hypothetical protein
LLIIKYAIGPILMLLQKVFKNNYPIFMVRVMVFNATFNNISGISWRSILFVEEIGVPGENHRPAANY